MGDLLINLLASVIAGATVWLAQFAIRRRRLDRERAFFGLADGTTCLLVTSRHFASPSTESVHRRDVAALVELTTLARECGARADLVGGTDLRHELGRMTEFCVGGPSANARTAVHLRTAMPGIAYEGLSFTADGKQYVNTAEDRYAVLARFLSPSAVRPVFLLGGLSSDGNLGAARHLANHHRDLQQAYGDQRPFCLVLRVREPEAYGTDFTEVAADVTGVAFTAPRTGED
ncbi:hypothetical protein AB0368_25495 [Actinoplanes sp. NPDC051475]|uniref:hypothetical protein n=1 Tax=Actinoplanes sp. NPDC051475 TaxID=3157225 RepID=UPI00344CAB7C